MKSTICPPTDEAKEVFLAGLKKVMPTAVVFSSVAPLEQLATRSWLFVSYLHYSPCCRSQSSPVCCPRSLKGHVKMFLIMP